jgi:hypothetical protein
MYEEFRRDIKISASEYVPEELKILASEYVPPGYRILAGEYVPEELKVLANEYVPEGHGILAGGETTGLIGQVSHAPRRGTGQAWRTMCHQLI